MKYALITGASTGIGKACAIDLAQKGVKVFAGVRKDSDFEALSSIHENLSPIIIDVVNKESIQKAYNQVKDIITPDDSFTLMNNAGIVKPGPLEHLDCEELANQMEVNVTSQVRVTQEFMPLLRLVADGRIIFTGSQSGYFTSPFMGAYCASKHAIEAVADVLRKELSLTSNIKVILLQPGQIKTPIWSKSLEREDEIRNSIPADSAKIYEPITNAVIGRAKGADENGAPTSDVSKCVWHAISTKNPKTRYRMGKGAKFSYLMTWLLSDRTMDKIVSIALRC